MRRRRVLIGVIAGVAGCGLLPGPAAGASAESARARTPYVALTVLSQSRATVLRTRTVRVRVISVIPASVSVTGVARLPARTGRAAARRTLVVARRTILPRRRSRILTLRLTTSGLTALRDCGAVTIELSARGIRLTPLKQLVNGRRQSSRLVTRSGRRAFRSELGSCRQGVLPIPGPGGFDARSGYFVGIAARSINPQPDGTFAGRPVYLGGYGIASPPLSPGRPATGILRNGVSVRAIAVSDGRHASAVADIEAQGWFVANKDAPLGLVDMRREVQRRTNGALPASAVVIQSDHSHSGPDFMGVWGGVPLEYRRLAFDRTVEAILAAYASRREGTLYYGTAPGRDLLSNQFEADPNNQAVDSDVRVLQARDAGNRPFATLLNFSAHTTVLGGDNTKVSGDWVEAANPQLERRFGGAAMTVVGTLGRTQPADRGCANGALTGDARSLCTLDASAARVVDRAAFAVEGATAVPGDPVVAVRSYLLQDPSTSPV
ncbi:MAG: hypothetical protein ACR2NH_11710, partial [Solirubrobacteraceae bacterium]